MSHYATLGLLETATEDEVKKAYRKLASKHHPDHGGKAADFQKFQEAYSAIEAAGFKPEPVTPPPADFWNGAPHAPGNSWRGDDINTIFEQMKRANRAAGPNRRTYPPEPNEVVVQVSLREAFYGFNVALPPKFGKALQPSVVIPGGMPNGHSGRYVLSDGSIAHVTMRIDDKNFSVRGLDDQDNLFSAGLNIGDVEVEREVDALDLITGAWLKMQDFLGEELVVRIPPGFNPLHRLKVAGKGYYGWEYDFPSKKRADMFLRVLPLFRKPADIERQKIIDLYNSVKNMGDAS